MQFTISTLSTDFIQKNAQLQLTSNVEGKHVSINVYVPFDETQHAQAGTVETRVKAEARRVLEAALKAL